MKWPGSWGATGPCMRYRMSLGWKPLETAIVEIPPPISEWSFANAHTQYPYLYSVARGCPLIKPEVLDAMLASGCTAEQIVAAVKASMSRSSGAERQARYRERKAQESVTSDVTLRNSDVVSPSPLPPPDKEPPKPQEINPPISPQPLRRASRLPVDFQPDLGLAEEMGLSASQAQNESAKFRDYWSAKAGKDAAKLDWPATWRNWIRSAVERLPRGSPNNPSHQKPRNISEASTRLLAQIRETENANSQSRASGQLLEQTVPYLAAPNR